MARRMSVDKGISNVGILRGGPNQDFFDPRSNSVTLGTEAYGQYSITAIATAVHEMGHASQYAEGYAFMKFRSAFGPVVNFCSNAWMIIFMLGLLMGAAGGIDPYESRHHHVCCSAALPARHAARRIRRFPQGTCLFAGHGE